MVINSGFLCLLSGANHCKPCGGTWRRLVTLRAKLRLDFTLHRCLAVVVTKNKHIYPLLFGEFPCSRAVKTVVCDVGVTLSKEVTWPTPDHHGKWRL